MMIQSVIYQMGDMGRNEPYNSPTDYNMSVLYKYIYIKYIYLLFSVRKKERKIKSRMGK